MILKAKERGGGKQLGLYLLKTDTNEHVELYELRGFVSLDLPSALQEIDAISRATKAKNSMFSMSLNPPPGEHVSPDKFSSAIDAVEKKLGLDGQPRAIVFHEVDGRRHAHAVWSRIDAGNMKAINLPFYKTKLRDVSKDLFLEHGWRLPRGFVDSRERDPTNFSLVEWQQAKRCGHDPKALRAMFRECWAASDSQRAFAAALASRGYTLARGDRRGHVVVDYRGEVYSIARYVGVKEKQVRSRLGDDAMLPSVEKAKHDHAARMTEMLQRHIREAEERRKKEAAWLLERRAEIVKRQREQRALMEKEHADRQARETKERAQRFANGFRGLWHRITGKHAKVRAQNEAEALVAAQRDRAERQKLVQRHIEERRPLHQQIKSIRQIHAKQTEELHRDVARFGDRQPAKETEYAEGRSQRLQREPERARTRRQRNRGGHEPER